MPLPGATFDEELLRRVIGEFYEMPGLRLNPSQARRLWGLDELTCSRVLEELVGSQFLVRGNNGHYTRRSVGRWPSQPEPSSLAAGQRSPRLPPGHQEAASV